MDDLTKELKLHTLAGDIQSAGMEGRSKAAIARFLKPRYVNPETGISVSEFAAALDEQFAKVTAWRIGNTD
jgi:hypothetical protein